MDFSDFIVDLSLRGFSPETIKAYKSDLEFFGSYLEDRGLKLRQVTHTIVGEFRMYMTTLKGRSESLGLAPATTYNQGDSHLPLVSSAANYLSLTFSGVATDVTYTVQASSDLTGAWTTIQTFPSGGVAPGTQTVQDTQSMSASSQRYMRLLMSSP